MSKYFQLNDSELELQCIGNYHGYKIVKVLSEYETLIRRKQFANALALERALRETQTNHNLNEFEEK